MSIGINYEKRKNQKLFTNLEKFDCTNTQNYIPIYKNFFLLNSTNYNLINWNHTHYVDNITRKEDENTYICDVANGDAKSRSERVFFKFAPLIDPIKVMIGKYANATNLTNLPQLESDENVVNPKLLDQNNSAYVDGGFSYLSNQLMAAHRFVHGVKFYGSFLSVKKNFKFNVYDDIEYLIKSDYFNKNKNNLFSVENYNGLFEDDASRTNLPVIQITSDSLPLHAESFDNSVFEDLFKESSIDQETDDSVEIVDLTLDNIHEHNLEIQGSGVSRSMRSDESCSSRTSHTNSNDNDENDDMDALSGTNNAGKHGDHRDNADADGDKRDDDDDDDDDDEDDDDDDDYSDESDDETLYATFKEFPVQIICMESCDDTLDQLIADDRMTEVKWLSMLMQVIMTLIAYQKAFSFTHNDLHTNNIMHVKTKKKYLYYRVKNKCYRVPTFGKIFKIIDFGRAIYKHDGKIMCSDSFGPTGDAARQYNIEPYYNPNKPRLEPNYSFDLCRLACSIFDYLVEDMSEIKDLAACDPVTRIIVEWCIDDNGINVLYKNNGTDRYPDFKLYKMIARCVHKHTPMAQLERPEFNAFMFQKDKIPKSEDVMNLDEL